ncbi:antifungal protein ginkbilobin-2 [Quercus suber]|uniref:Antifungal protein ginkbilobin-2 n=1 Tax=Quercus suber TaxID=58331 RepID=A0AAW0M2X1_QUESU
MKIQERKRQRIGIARCVPDTNVTTVLCNSGVYSQGDPFVTSLNYVVAELESVTPTYKNYDYYNISPYPNAFAYDCTTCLAAAKTAMFSTCQSQIGARAVLHDCNIRYEQYPFTI